MPPVAPREGAGTVAGSSCGPLAHSSHTVLPSSLTVPGSICGPLGPGDVTLAKWLMFEAVPCWLRFIICGHCGEWSHHAEDRTGMRGWIRP